MGHEARNRRASASREASLPDAHADPAACGSGRPTAGWSPVGRAAANEGGFGLVQVVISITVLTVVISALLAVFAASTISLHRSSVRGTALSLAEGQLEIYRTVGFRGIRLNGALIPTAATDPYVTAHTADVTIPPSTGQAVGGRNGDDACPGVALPAACYPVQTVTGPDGGRRYTIDSYVDYVNDDAELSIRAPRSGLALKKVTVVVRDPTDDTVLVKTSAAFQGP